MLEKQKIEKIPGIRAKIFSHKIVYVQQILYNCCTVQAYAKQFTSTNL